MKGAVRLWLHTRNALRRSAPGREWKHWHDLDALGPLARLGNAAARERIAAIERRYLDRLNRKGRD